jgi:hypothetical protein
MRLWQRVSYNCRFLKVFVGSKYSSTLHQVRTTRHFICLARGPLVLVVCSSDREFTTVDERSPQYGS